MSDSSPAFRHGLETPHPLQPCQNYLRLEGWAFLPEAPGPTQARIRIGNSIHLPQQTRARPDVAADHPDDEHARQSGFVFVVFLPFGNHLGHLEVSADEGHHWHALRSIMVPVSSHPLMGEFEPFGQGGKLKEAVRLAGWVWHPEFKIAKSVLLMGDREVPLLTGMDRPDVAQRFPENSAAARAGFMSAENLPRGQGAIRLQVTTEDGRTFLLDSGVRAEIKQGAYTAPRLPPEMWELPPAEFVRPETAQPCRHPGPHNILFVLYGDFTSNSAFHVTALANELAGMGYDCVVAVPEHPETIGAQPDSRFLAAEYADWPRLASFYRDGTGPSLIHAWTTRESVRKFCQKMQAEFSCDLIIHLEDNEQVLLAHHLSCSIDDIPQIGTRELARRVPDTLSHPMRSRRFLASAQGVTSIIEPLGEFVPQGIAHAVIWPAATTSFQALPRNNHLRDRLGIGGKDKVIFYHGNVHQANFAEMRELYLAVQQLNHHGHPTWLVRAGRDSPDFAASAAPLPGEHLIEIGFIKRAKDLPWLMSMADYFVQPGKPGPFNDYRFPSKLPEFFAIGRPIILPRTNLAKELRHRQDAYLLDEADAGSIAEAIMILNQDPALVRKLSAAALDFSQARFSWHRSARELIDFYHQNTRLQRPGTRQQAAARMLWTTKMPETNPSA